jgi:acyl-[acyl-carrier-protein]-phospholipid O-acyltransferase/long-chain-fatty-acid--[acyl-carrier-protein] ligase
MSATFVLLGFLGGVFIIPLNSLIQYHAKEDEVGTILAGNNWVQNIFMVAFLGFTIVLAHLGVSSTQIFYILMTIALFGAIYTVYELPHSLTRIIAAALIKGKYDLRVVGFDNLPKQGGVLLLGNHISWIDWALIQIACPRPVRFVMLRSIYNRWYLKPLMQLFGVIPISAGHSRESLILINEKLKSGEVVCLFPEGAITKTGTLGLFHSGYERAVEGIEGVIVPFYLHGMWGSRFSRADSERLRKNTARGNRRDIIVAFGPSLSKDTKADQLKQKIFELSFDAWESHAERFDPLPLAWIKQAKTQLSSPCVIEGESNFISHSKMMALVATLARDIRNNQHSSDNAELNVGILLPASAAAVMANMAVMFNGQTPVNLNYTSSVAAVQSGIRNARIQRVYSSKKFIEKLRDKGIDVDALLSGVNVVHMEEFQKSISKTFFAVSFLAAYLLPASWYYQIFGHKVSVNDPAAILFSSGSESTPKGVVLSHRNFMSNIKQISDVLRTSEDDVVMGCLPPFHSFGLTVTTLLPLVEGIPVVCHPDPTDVLNIAKSICLHDVTILCATATFLRLYTKNRKVNPLMLAPLRIVVAGAEKVSPVVRDEFKAKFNKDVYEGYGATETTPVASVNIPNQLFSSDWSVQVGHKEGSVGLPVPGCSFRIVDPQTLKSLPIGEDGLILISGTQVMLGYLNDEEKTRSAIVDIDGRRWYKTGDKGHLDADGFLTIVDRYSRFAKIGGEMISLTAVEQELRRVIENPDIEILAVSIPDEAKGEKIVLLSSGVLEMSDIRGRLLANNCNPLMIPSAIKIVESIPKLGIGKNDLSQAKKIAMEA